MKQAPIRLFVFLFLGMLAFGVPPGGLKAAANWPNLMNYQGRLTDPSGNPVTDGPYNITFNLYASAVGGASLWSETQAVSVTKSLFNAVLGSVNSMGAIALSNYTSDLWIGVSVGADAEMTPRQQLLPAIYAKNSQALAGLLPNNSANNLVVLDGSGKIPAGLVQGGSLAPPIDLAGSSASYHLNVSNSSAVSSALGLKVSAPNAIFAQATDPAGYGVWGQGVSGMGVIASSVGGLGLSATSQSTSNPVILASGAFPGRFVSNAAVAGNYAIQASTLAGDQIVNLADRGNKAGLFSSVTAASTFAVSATASSATAIYGQTASSGAADYGVFGVNNGAAATGAGVEGIGFMGVQGQVNQNAGRAVEGDVAANFSNAFGVFGTNSNDTGTAILGRHLGLGAGMGVRGGSAAGVGAIGIYGTVSAAAAVGAEGFGSAADAFGVEGIQGNASPISSVAGVYGKAKGAFAGMGVRGEGYQGVYGLGNGNGFCGVCAYTNNSTGYGLYANSAFEAILAESSNTSLQGFGVVANIQSVAGGSAAGSFNAQGTAGVTYGVYSNNNSATGFGIYSTSPNINFYSESSSHPFYGFYHNDSSHPGGGIGVWSVEACPDCVGGYFENQLAKNGNSGAALMVAGRVAIQQSAGTFLGLSGETTHDLQNDYILPNSLVFLTVASATSSVAAVTAKIARHATITFTPPLAANTTYQYLVIGQ